MDTLIKARELLEKNWDEGVNCPCCGQFAKRYKRSLCSSTALVLMRMFVLHRQGREWVHINKDITPQSGGHFSISKHWEMIEQKEKEEDEEEEKRTSGQWKLTEKGEMFVLGQISVPVSVYTYDNNNLGLTGKLVTIKDILSKKFNYSELMGEYINITPQASLL